MAQADAVGEADAGCSKGKEAAGILDAYQGLRANSAKMSPATKPDGKRLEYRHEPDAHELCNHSFVAASPDHQRLVSGEFGTQKRPQVFPAPLLKSP